MIDIIKAVKEKFNASNYPVSGPTYILPDGSFLDIAGTFDPKNSYEDFPCHAEVEGFLLDIGLSNQVVDVSGSPTLESLGAIRCNDLADNNFIQLSNIRPTSDQYESLENWIYENATHRSELIVATPEFIQYKKYDPEDVEYIIKRIKRYYTSGNLYENMTENKSLDEAKKKKRKKKKQKALGWWQTFTPDAGNVLMNNAFFNHTMGNTTTDEFVADMDAAMGEFGGDVGSCGMGESFSKDEHFYRVEVFNDNIYVGGLFRGLNDLINDLYDADDPYYDYLNDPLSELEYKTTFPKNFDHKDVIFAYKENKYKELEETILDLQYALNEIGWDLKVREIAKPKNIIYEDDEQIAYIVENLKESSYNIVEANKHKSKNIKNNSPKTLIWYETESGNKPAKDFYNSLEKNIQQKFKLLLKALEDNQLPISENRNRRLNHKYNINELKVTYNNCWYRLTYMSKNNYILLTGFQKKSNKTPDNEVDKAIECCKNYLKYNRGEEVIL